ncbi:hypothetical protein RhiXN_08980 [Rhizoctonia solani]|uniref:Uncharacterized protein n=1 Tax=Rhizoctonia solani TaxID=456999 RepID=A0A8H8NUZ9_9AGAM|nr:uncharacterized protein RhiXN_08980 [Rhizoctonia solani]QRW20005.1 hypothetical protein RhiXN_08980 [Rhizoctonia solani]
MNGPEEMRAHLNRSANIIHALMSASSCNKVRFFKRDMGEEGPDTLYGKQVYRWWHFIASHTGAFRDLAQWHHHGLATTPPTVSTPPSARELTQAVQNLILLYPVDLPAYTSRPATPVTPPACQDTPRPTEMHAPAPLPIPLFSSMPDTCWTPGYSSPLRETQWEPQSYLGWSNEEIRRNVETFEGRENEELFSFEELRAIDCSGWM